MMMDKSLNHTPSVLGKFKYCSWSSLVSVSKDLMIMLIDWITLELDLSIVSLKTWDGLNTTALPMKKPWKVLYLSLYVSLTCNDKLHCFCLLISFVCSV